MTSPLMRSITIEFNDDVYCPMDNGIFQMPGGVMTTPYNITINRS